MSDIALKVYCQEHGVDPDRARRYAREGLFGKAHKVLGRWAVPEDMPLPALPDPDPFPGRERVWLYVSDLEFAVLEGQGARVLRPARLHELGVEEALVLQDAQRVAGHWLYRFLRRWIK